jgi:Oxidoreductase-like protein, N-terminal
MSTEEKARIVFGWQEGGPYKKSPRYNPASYTSSSTSAQRGMGVPPRPAEPDNCCMSGCVHCVWDDYRDDVEAWAEGVRKANIKARGKGGMSMDDDGGGSETNWTEGMGGDGELFKGIPVGIREFMRTEKRLKERQERRARRGEHREGRGLTVDI